MPTRISPRRCSRSCAGADRALRGAQGARRRARFPRPAAQGARPRARQRRRAPRLPGRFTHIFVDEFQDTDPLQAEILLLLAAADPGSDDWRARHARSPAASSSSAIRSSRSTASAAPTSASTARCASGSIACGADPREADDELPQRAGDPGVRQRRVRAGDDRRPSRCRRTTSAVAVPRRHRRAAGGRRAAGAGAVRHRGTSRR